MARSPSRDETWVVPFRALGARAPLFCACAGGGDAFEYRHLALALPEDQPVYAFGLPEPENRRGILTVHQIATLYVDKVREYQPEGPYHLCGHSFGGLVVYEMAAQLTQRGEKVALVGLLDTLHPSYKEKLTLQGQTQYQLTYLHDRFGKYGRNLRSGRIDRVVVDALAFFYHRVQRLWWRMAGNICLKFGWPVPHAIRNDKMVLLTAWYHYVPSEYRGPLVLFNAAERSAEYQVDRTLGWRASAHGKLDVETVPGDHYTMLHPPQVNALADRLLHYMGSAEPERA